MALSAAEKKELDDLRKRAESAEKVNKELATANETLTTAVDDANVEIAQAAIDKQNAIDEALEAQEADFAGRLDQAKTGRVDKSVSPEKPPKFDKGAYFSECFGGEIAFAQGGWFYDHKGEPVKPVNEPVKAKKGE